MTTENLGRVLVVDDEVEVMETLCEMLEVHGYRTAGFSNGPDALKELRVREYDLLITDLVMPGMDGITFLNACLEIDPHLVGIVMTGQGSVKTAVAAMKTGAFDYILKPFKLNTILVVLFRAMSVRRLKSENIELRGTVAMYELTRAVSVTTDLAVIADKVADAAMEQCRADEVSVLLPSGNDGELYVAAVRGEGRDFLTGQRIAAGEGIAGWVASGHEGLTLEGEVRDNRFKPLYPRSDLKAALSIPMMAGGKFVGVLNVNTIRRRSFTPGQMKALTIMAGIAAPSLENALLFRQLSEAEKNYRNIFENAVEGIFQAATDGRFLTANPALANMLGYSSPDELLSLITDIRLQIYVDGARYDESRRRLEKGEELRGFETQVYRKDGSAIWVSMSARRIRDLSGGTACYECAVEDITERKHAEESLRESEERYRIAIEQSNDGIAIVRGSEHIYVNRKFVEMFGYDRPDELVGKPVAMVVDPMDRDALAGINPGRPEGVPAPGKYEFRGIKKNGESIYVEASAANTLYHGEIVSLAYFRDVTYRRKAEEELRTSYEQVRKTMGSAIQAMSMTVEMRDPYTSGHQKRVSLLARGIAAEMGMTDHEVEGIRIAGIIHDIGKISVPAEILSKPARLSEIEFDLIKCHSQSGFDILRELEFPWPLAEIVLQHHERLDGSGYPKHLKNGTILPQARIIAVADVVEAIASHRPYRPALGIEVALREIEEKKNILYDEDAVDMCVRLFKEKGFTFNE